MAVLRQWGKNLCLEQNNRNYTVFTIIWRIIWETREQICENKVIYENVFSKLLFGQFGMRTSKGNIIPANRQKLIEIWHDTKKSRVQLGCVLE